MESAVESNLALARWMLGDVSEEYAANIFRVRK
jgi:hypothetical protein